MFGNPKAIPVEAHFTYHWDKMWCRRKSLGINHETLRSQFLQSSNTSLYRPDHLSGHSLELLSQFRWETFGMQNILAHSPLGFSWFILRAVEAAGEPQKGVIYIFAIVHRLCHNFPCCGNCDEQN